VEWWERRTSDLARYGDMRRTRGGEALKWTERRSAPRTLRCRKAANVPAAQCIPRLCYGRSVHTRAINDISSILLLAPIYTVRKNRTSSCPQIQLFARKQSGARRALQCRGAQRSLFARAQGHDQERKSEAPPLPRLAARTPRARAGARPAVRRAPWRLLD